MKVKQWSLLSKLTLASDRVIQMCQQIPAYPPCFLSCVQFFFSRSSTSWINNSIRPTMNRLTVDQERTEFIEPQVSKWFFHKLPFTIPLKQMNMPWFSVFLPSHLLCQQWQCFRKADWWTFLKFSVTPYCHFSICSNNCNQF